MHRIKIRAEFLQQKVKNGEWLVFQIMEMELTPKLKIPSKITNEILKYKSMDDIKIEITFV